MKLSVPSLVYAVQNNMAFLALSNLDAAVYQVSGVNDIKSSELKKKKNVLWDLAVHTFNPRTLYLCEFQASYGYILKLCLKKRQLGFV